MLTIDTHVHTVHSGDSPTTVKEAIKSAKERGLDGIAITDHDSVDGLDKALQISEDEDFLILPGIEVSSKHGHILGLGVRELIPSKMTAEDTVKKIRENGGVAISAHPFSLDPKPFSILNANFDAVETFNSKRYVGNRFAKKYAKDNNLNKTGGSDAHFPDEIGLAGIKIDCKPFEDEVIKKIREGKVSVFGRFLPLKNYLRRALFASLRVIGAQGRD